MTKLLPEHGIQTVIVNEKARIIDVVMVLQSSEEAFLLGSSGTSSAIISWFKKFVITDDVRFSDLTTGHQTIEIMGPRSAEVVEGLLAIDCGRWSLGQWVRAEVDHQDVVVVRMPSACEMSFVLVAAPAALELIAGALRNTPHLVPELTPMEAEYLRVVSGLGAYDHEWSGAYNPLEAGLLHLTSFTKGCYIGQEVIARLDSYNKVKQRIMGITAQTMLHEGDVIVVGEQPVGVLTTVVPSCDGQSWLALGYIRGEHAVTSTPVVIQSGDAVIPAMQYLPPLEDPSCR